MNQLPIEDAFRGDNTHLKSCIEALIRMNDDGKLVPYSIGSHARELLAAAFHRLPDAEMQAPSRAFTFTKEDMSIFARRFVDREHSVNPDSTPEQRFSAYRDLGFLLTFIDEVFSPEPSQAFY